jgi:hypothetical protein
MFGERAVFMFALDTATLGKNSIHKQAASAEIRTPGAWRLIEGWRCTAEKEALEQAD